MAKLGRPKGRKTTGVMVRQNQQGLYAQWTDPRSGNTVCATFNKLVREGHILKATRAAAAKWLKDKAAELAKWKREGITLSGINAKWSSIEADYLKAFAAEHGQEAADFLNSFHLRYWRDFSDSRGLQTGADLKRVDLGRFRASLPAGLQPSYRNRIMGAIRAFLGWCIDAEHVALTRANLKESLAKFKEPEGIPRVLGKSELKRLVQALVEHDNAILSYKRKGRFKGKTITARNRREPLAAYVLLLLLTGCRPGEALTVRATDVDSENGRLRIWGSKTAKMREVVADKSPALLSLLRTLRLKAGGSTYLLGDWTSEEGSPIPREVHHRQWKRLAKLAGLEGTPIKALRSTCVAYFASAGAESEYLLQSRFGHSGDVSTRFYRQPLRGLKGDTLEEWYGIKAELTKAMQSLGMAGGLALRESA